MQLDFLSPIYDKPRPWHGLFGAAIMAGGLWIGYNTPLATMRINEAAASAFLYVGGWLWAVNGVLMGYHKKLESDSLAVIDRRQEVIDAFAKQRANGAPEKEALPPIKVDGRPLGMAYTQTAQPVRLDYERSMATALVQMRDAGFPMNISETYWIREGHWKDGPESFRMTRGKWEYYNIVGKRGSASNSRYEIQNERGVELIADGKLKLPPPPQ